MGIYESANVRTQATFQIIDPSTNWSKTKPSSRFGITDYKKWLAFGRSDGCGPSLAVKQNMTINETT